jgi:curved DNA-binding protein CbpA
VKKTADQNFYDRLGVGFGASSFEINHAYKENRQLYHEDSLVTYSLLSGAEREEILTGLEEAYLTLIDEEKRSRYDQSLLECGILMEKGPPRDDRRRFRLITSDSQKSSANSALVMRQELKGMVPSNPVIQEILSREVLCGVDLKTIRGELGVSLEVIAEMTKIRIVFLRAIEEDEFERTPSRMFLKSFLKAYAQSLGLEADVVASRYLRRIEN